MTRFDAFMSRTFMRANMLAIPFAGIVALMDRADHAYGTVFECAAIGTAICVGVMVTIMVGYVIRLSVELWSAEL